MFRQSRILIGVSVLVGSVAFAVALPLGTDVASAHGDSGAVTCKKLSVPPTNVATFSKCSTAVGGSGTARNWDTLEGNITWADGTFTDYTDTNTVGKRVCPKKMGQQNINGSVTASSNAAIPVGSSVSMIICYNTNIPVTVHEAKGHPATF